jgi:hypothetical protein
MGRVKRGSMAGEPAYLQKNPYLSPYFPWRKNGSRFVVVTLKAGK